MQSHRFLSPFERWKSGLLIEVAVFAGTLVVLALFTALVSVLV